MGSLVTLLCAVTALTVVGLVFALQRIKSLKLRMRELQTFTFESKYRIDSLTEQLEGITLPPRVPKDDIYQLEVALTFDRDDEYKGYEYVNQVAAHHKCILAYTEEGEFKSSKHIFDEDVNSMTGEEFCGHMRQCQSQAENHLQKWKRWKDEDATRKGITLSTSVEFAKKQTRTDAAINIRGKKS